MQVITNYRYDFNRERELNAIKDASSSILILIFLRMISKPFSVLVSF